MADFSGSLRFSCADRGKGESVGPTLPTPKDLENLTFWRRGSFRRTMVQARTPMTVTSGVIYIYI